MPLRTLGRRQREPVDAAITRAIAGNEDTVTEALEDLAARTGADEPPVSSSTWDRDASVESDAAPARIPVGA